MSGIRRIVMLAASIALAAASCALPTDDEAAIIDSAELPDVLRTDLEVTTTTEPGPLTERVQIFLLSTENERTTVVQTGREIDFNSSFEQEIGLLFRSVDVPDIRTEDEIEQGWFNALSQFQLTDAFTEDGVAVIDMVALDADGEPIPLDDVGLRDAIAQLVYTAQGFPDSLRAVRVLIGGEQVFLPTDGEDSDAVLTVHDYAIYSPDFESPTTNEPATTTTTTPEADG